MQSDIVKKSYSQGVNKSVFFNHRLRISLISFANMLIATFLQIFLEGHYIWCQDGQRSPISGGKAVNMEKPHFLKIGQLFPYFRCVSGSPKPPELLSKNLII